MPLVPYFSLALSAPKNDSRVAEIAKQKNVSASQVHIAWLLHKSPWLLPIPGTSQLKHLEENIAAADIVLTEEDMAFLG